MYAVIKTGGKQYRVAKDDVIRVEKLAAEAGDTIKLTDVLMVGDDKGVTVGDPTIAGAEVSAEVVEQTRGDKVIIFKKKRRHTYRRTKGHRQHLTVLKITDIAAKKKAAPKKKAAAKTTKADEAAKGDDTKTTDSASGDTKE
ncbi:50S ribosomal protein L21 [Rhodothalassium salexigens]|uniref:50S ribosomal protein L21 n=1 Tax=Rhodothalassium salexigens TaxID=1086 RepID=UPI001913096F|nr:50S ribosomal protein L21 [Rhodothalassium salexigens]MBK5920402.1 50S ribosomal protein L21 [Rhodothalassium salexigens]